MPFGLYNPALVSFGEIEQLKRPQRTEKLPAMWHSGHQSPGERPRPFAPNLRHTPFLNVTSRQLTPGVPSRDSKTGVIGPPVGGFVNIMQNLGSTPAYDVEYEVRDQHFTCVALDHKLAIAPHHTIEHRTFCEARYR